MSYTRHGYAAQRLLGSSRHDRDPAPATKTGLVWLKDDAEPLVQMTEVDRVAQVCVPLAEPLQQGTVEGGDAKCRGWKE